MPPTGDHRPLTRPPPTTRPSSTPVFPQPADDELRRFPLSRRRILHAALRLVDTEGLDALSMRRLAAELQVTPRALYHYVNDKEDLLHGVGDAVLSELRPPPPHTQPWTSRIMWTMVELRRVLGAHPNVVPLFATRTMSLPAVARTAAVVMGALRQAGFDDQTTVRSFCALFHYVLRFAVVEAGPPTAPGALAEALRRAQAEPLAAPGRGEPAHMTAVGSTPDGLMTERALATDAQFTCGLRLLVRALKHGLP
jgi:TetR/AcrR family transcriptional regulator, tetracycline repressor protein